MHISINTAEEISDLDRQVLALLAGTVVGTLEYTEEPDEEPEPEPEPTPRRTTRKATAKKPEPEPEPEPEEEPEPMAEEAVEEEPEEDEAGDEQSDEDLLALAVKKATEMVGGGEAAKVREALDAAGASRVRELNADNVRDFFAALS